MLVEAYKRCLSTLSHCLSGLLDGEQPISLTLAGHSVDTFRYQVSQDKVSIHLPVCRLLAGTHNGQPKKLLMFCFWTVEDKPFDFLQGFTSSSAGLGSHLVSQNNSPWSVLFLLCLFDLYQNVSLY